MTTRVGLVLLLALATACSEAPIGKSTKNSPKGNDSSKLDQAEPEPDPEDENPPVGDTDPDPDDDIPAPDNTTPPTPTTPSPTTPTTPTTPTPQAKRLRGTLGATSAASYGGGEHCNFRVTLRNVEVDVQTDASGKVTSATVSATAEEEILSNPCVNKVIPSHRMTWSLASSFQTSAGAYHISLNPGGQNKPPSELSIDGKLSEASSVSLSWHRTDYPAPLDWRIRTSVSMR